MSVSQTIKNHPHLEGVDPEDVLDIFWDHSVIGCTLVTLDNHWLHPSPELCDWLGYTREQLEKMTWVDITIRTDRQEDLDAVNAVMSGELDHYKMFKTYVRRNETLMPATLAVVPIKNSSSKVVMFLSQIERDERENSPPPISEIQIVWGFLIKHKRNLIFLALLSHIAAALLGKYFLLWLQEFLSVLPGLPT